MECMKESLVLHGKHVRLETLEHRHVDGLVSASAGDGLLYRWSPVPRGEVEATKYVDTALSLREAGSALAFAIHSRRRRRRDRVYAILQLGAMGLAEGLRLTRPHDS